LLDQVLDTQYRLAMLLTVCGRAQRKPLEDVSRGWDEFSQLLVQTQSANG
jgi:hypothetical protein